MNKKILYVDMDGVLVNWPEGHDDLTPGAFGNLQPVPGAIRSFAKLSRIYDVYILSTAPWDNPSAWGDKLEWVQKYLGPWATKKLILSHNKNLNRGDYLIDDRPNNGAAGFEGEWIKFGSTKFPDWSAVMDYLNHVDEFEAEGVY